MPIRVSLDVEPELRKPEELFLELPTEPLYLVPAGVSADAIVAVPGFRDPSEASVDDVASPVVQLVPPRSTSGTIENGRLYTEPKHASAKSLYDALVRFTSDWAQTSVGKVRVGPEAEASARRGEIQLALFNGERLSLPKRGTP